MTTEVETPKAGERQSEATQNMERDDQPIVHELKCWMPYYQDVYTGVKQFEVRRDDRNYAVGDSLYLREWDQKGEFYTGRWCVRRVTYLLKGGFGLPDDMVVMGIK